MRYTNILQSLEKLENWHSMDIQKGMHSETVTKLWKNRFSIDNCSGWRVTTYNNIIKTAKYIAGEIEWFNLKRE